MNCNHANTGMAFIRRVGFVCLMMLTSLSVWASDSSLEKWIARQLQAKDIQFISVIDHKLWPQSPLPNTHIILGVGQLPSPETSSGNIFFPYVLLIQAQDLGKVRDLKLLAISVPDKSVEGRLASMLADPAYPQLNGAQSIDLGPYPLRKGEWGFGIRYRVSAIGNRGGCAYEILGLFRYHNSDLKEILRDVVWAYSKYESGDKSCNSEMIIAPEMNGNDGFVNYIRKHARSYYGENRANSRSAALAGMIETPVDSCASFPGLQSINIHRWDPRNGLYLDSKGERQGHLLWWDSLFKGTN